ncbi:hypothetical protein EHH44_14470 [Mycolicibacter terrae]|uniref:Transmembrane protein n=2 Tax=Mycolicibacter TaxID=1073531 RepID=A0A1A2XUK3_MYCSD|nr:MULTISPECIES: DUF5336 domain-containing protein [Mycolicibacter]OBH21269.1 hypothetical protein A5694_14240 [Mycolicibacter sinensis]OBI28581.1 hypothetical protein A5710_03440 [Mycolicibacter sinensis]RRR43341.1 hypothetical protein EHH44_14470 [Mycolicibacter terrae]
MTYSPGNPGFQPSQPPGSYGPSTPSFAKSGSDAESKLPLYLQIAVVVLGFGVYLANFGPIVTVTDGEYPLILGDAGHTVPLAVLAALLAGAGLLPKAKLYTAVVAVIASLGALLAISTIADSGDNYTIGWGLWLVLTFSILQAAAAIGSLLLEAGVVTAPAPRPKYDPYAQYGLPPGGNYYGQPGQQGYGHQGQSGYPSYGGYPSAPSTGGFGVQGAQSAPGSASTGGFSSGAQQAQQSAPQGPPTPPTGFPSFSQPQTGGSGSSSTGGQGGSGQGQSSTGGQQSQGGSAPSGPAQT